MFDSKAFKDEVQEGGELVIRYQNENAYFEGSDLPKKTLKDVADYNAKYLEEFANASTKIAEARMEKDSSINKVIVEAPFSVSKRGSVTNKVNREQEFHIPNSNGETMKKSTVTLIVKDPSLKVSKSKIKELETALTGKLLVK